ncbi:F-box/LRR-repeat protein At4g14103-like isoform X1 [Corylus avellana]|uniref:F-box/LRR-repeat protein At4g14103-like isoform X1 n=1 Tax=Corylus avellana TaxID=13451 RepID=UPI00286AAB42|nr:F-box/LRR-repeat protein At4g14103-like isoform X1 [Corylus avellana]
METSCLIQEPQKKQKLNEEDEDIDGNSKCLSDLPEEILRHILSFLPTKHAVRTSVLSKRWEYLWASIPNLDFKRSLPTYFNGPIEKYKSKRRLLMNFVERVLCLRDSYAIKRFTLPCDVLGDAARVNTWISAVVRHNVQELNIYLDKFKGEFSLPYCLFTCKTLTSLHLNMPCILELPTTIWFSNLKNLTIEYVTFSDEYLTQHLFSGLPVLKKLSLTDCSWGGLKVVCISAPKLHSLSIWESERPDSSYGDGCEVLIFAVRLKEFEYSGELFINYCLNNSFSLEKAEITVFSNNTSAQVAHRMYKLLIGLSNVKLLQLSCAVVEVLIDAAEHLLHMPMFNNLTDLILYDGYWSVALDSVLLRILHKSPCLETLKFWKGIRLWENDDWILDPVPPCFLSHVKWIEVGDYDGDREEFSAVKILLKNAVVLNEIVIFCSVHLRGNLEKQENLYKQLIEIPKGSRNCKIVLK